MDLEREQKESPCAGREGERKRSLGRVLKGDEACREDAHQSGEQAGKALAKNYPVSETYVHLTSLVAVLTVRRLPEI